MHKNPTISIWSWALHHSKHIFYFQEIREINGIQFPFTLGIQTPMQCQSMPKYGHNGAISMDATIGTNDVKYHLFTLMGFDVHHTKMLLAWIITSRQVVDDLIELFQPLKTKMLSIMPNWRPSCFIIDDALQELHALGWTWIILHFFLHNYAQWRSKVFLVQGLFHS